MNVKNWVFALLFSSILGAACSAQAVDGYSHRVDWAVASGFWENVIRGNDSCVEYVSEDLKKMAMVWASEFRDQLTTLCGPKFNDGDVESDFSVDSLPGGTKEGSQVRIKGQAVTSCKRKKVTLIKAEVIVGVQPKPEGKGELEVSGVRTISVEQPAAKKKKSKKK